MNWKDELRHSLSDPSDFITVNQSGNKNSLPHEIIKITDQFPMRIPPHYLNFLNLLSDSDDPLWKMAVPSAHEFLRTPKEQDDPTGDEHRSPLPGAIHRYPDRLLILTTNECALYCRFCFRKSRLKKAIPHLSSQGLTKIVEYVRQTPSIREIILSGGDPLCLPTKKLKKILTSFRGLPQIETIRIHTRTPVALPSRFTPKLLKILKNNRPLWLVSHINHARELTPEALTAIESILSSSIPILNQSVLLRGVNDSLKSMLALLRALISASIKPYYLHQLDRAPGTAHFYVPVSEGQKLIKELRGVISGYAIPHYVIDIPGGFGKVPLCGGFIQSQSDKLIYLETFDGSLHSYSLDG